MAPNFLSAAWLGEDSHVIGVEDIKRLILCDALFSLDGGRRRKGKKKIAIGEEGFPRTGPALLAVSWIAAVRSIKG
jgi:hypothetical protein